MPHPVAEGPSDRFLEGQSRVHRAAVPLFEGNPLIFKQRKGWAGEGRRVGRIGSWYFIVIAPDDWERMGRAPVEPDGCTVSGFRAHYFHRDAAESDGIADGFREWHGSLEGAGIELAGQRLYDDSDDGLLFVGDPPGLITSPEIRWARVGEETERGWGLNFQPDSQSLPEVLDGREGRFFLRIYDAEARMLDSVAFRYARDLTRIEIDGANYA